MLINRVYGDAGRFAEKLAGEELSPIFGDGRAGQAAAVLG